MVSFLVGRDGLTHNMLNDIHNHWKHAEAVRIKCLGVCTVDMKNVCTQLEVLFKINTTSACSILPRKLSSLSYFSDSSFSCDSSVHRG